MQSIQYSVLRARLAETLRHVAATAEPVLISRRGRPAGVLMSWARYSQLSESPANDRSGFADGLIEWRAAAGLSGDAFEGDSGAEDPFAGLREGDTGRPVNWPV